jgi:hypothetical protein
MPPLNWLAAHSAVAALLLPPPRPAPVGTFLSRCICIPARTTVNHMTTEKEKPLAIINIKTMYS